MKKMYKVFLSFIIFFLFPFIVKAGSANISMSGGSVYVGKDITVTFKLNSVTDGKLVSFGGYLNYDSNYVEPISCKSSSALGVKYNESNKKFAFVDNSVEGISSGNIGSCTFKTKKVGTTSISVRSAETTNEVPVKLTPNISKATVTINNPPSNNNNLSSLSVTNGSINFSPSNTNYSINVESNITSVSISATPADSKAKVSGTGNRNLNFGNNSLDVVVTAEDGSKKTYTINVNRKDNRSSNNNLSSLTVSSGSLSFNKNTTNYNIEVPYDVTKVTINAKAEDPKAKVNIQSPDLVSEEIRTAKVTVTAENGSNKVYSIDIRRGKDPNKPLSNNNYLKELEVSVGILSPVFDKEKTNYAVYLPYEVSNIEITTSVEDEKYAKLEKEENNNLSIGNNPFKYTVTAEDGTKRVYTVTVVRNKSLDDNIVETNTYLKSLVLENSKLSKEFNKEDNIIYYKKGNNVSIKEALPLIEENSVYTYKVDNAFVIMVETPSGQRGFYILLEENNILLIVIITFSIILLGLLFIIFKDKIFHKKRIKS